MRSPARLMGSNEMIETDRTTQAAPNSRASGRAAGQGTAAPSPSDGRRSRPARGDAAAGAASSRDYVPLRPWWWFCRTVAFVPYWLLFGARTIGIRRVPRRGPVILACNHQSFFDPVLATIGLSRESSYMARDSLFEDPRFGWLIRSLNAIPVKRRSADVGALKEMLRRLRDGYVVVTFPEETRTEDGRVRTMLAGTVLLAQKSRATIVPVCIDGAYEAWPRTQPLPGPGRVVIAYGQPLRPEDIRGREADEVAAQIRRRIIELQHRVRPLSGRRPFDYDS